MPSHDVTAPGGVPFTERLSYGPGVVDWQARIDPAELRRQRASRARTVMREHEVSAVLVSGAAYLRYLTGLTGPEFCPSLWYVLFPAEGEPVVFAHAGYDRTLRVEAPWVSEIRTARSWLRGIPGDGACKEEARLFAAEINTERTRLGIDSERLGIVGFDRYAREALTAAGVGLIPGEPALMAAMAVKTPIEIDCLRMAGAITDRMWAAMASATRVGMSDAEVSAIGRSAGSTGGADQAVAGLRAGILTVDRGLKGTNQFLNPGDLAFGNLCGTSYMGYKSCVYRTFVVGREPTADEQSRMSDLQGRIFATIGDLRPGGSTDVAARHFPKAKDLGFDDEVDLLTIEIGHGIGLHQYEYPAVNRQWSLNHPQEITAGMVIAVEGHIDVPGRGGLRIESMCVVTDRGPEVIDRFPTDIRSVG
ncbi:MAG: hypothetical protein JWN97_2965 [Nocardioides sp.]|nr:hypothetical protein [Nocardioides sp.]